MTENSAPTAADYAALVARVEAAEAKANGAPPPKPKKITLTKANEYKANQRGYVEGTLIEPEDIVPAGVAVSDQWMEEIEGSGKRARAVREAQADHPGDPNLEALSKPALEAMAAERGINTQGLSKADLIVAIRAEREPTI